MFFSYKMILEESKQMVVPNDRPVGVNTDGVLTGMLATIAIQEGGTIDSLERPSRTMYSLTAAEIHAVYAYLLPGNGRQAYGGLFS